MAELTKELSDRLKAPFSQVSWRVQSKLKNDETRARVVPYVDARDVMDRLDEVIGPNEWSFDWEPVVISNNAVLVAKGTLHIFHIYRADVGEAGDIEKTKAAVSDALKRAAVHFGIGRYLYDLGAQYATIDKFGNITDQEKKRLDSVILAHINHQAIPQQSSVTQQETTQQQGQSSQQTTAPTRTAMGKEIGVLLARYGIDPAFAKTYRQDRGYGDDIGRLLADLKNPETLVVQLIAGMHHIPLFKLKAFMNQEQYTHTSFATAFSNPEERTGILTALSQQAA